MAEEVLEVIMGLINHVGVILSFFDTQYAGCLCLVQGW